jgi:hypothetical protein
MSGNTFPPVVAMSVGLSKATCCCPGRSGGRIEAAAVTPSSHRSPTQSLLLPKVISLQP